MILERLRVRALLLRRAALPPSLAVVLVGTAALATAAVAQERDEAAVTAERLAPGLHLLSGAGGGQAAGNALASIGPQGVSIVDTGFPPFVPKYRAAIAELGGGDIRFAINTHWHDDHAEGNKVLGPDGTLLIAHANSRDMLTRHNK